MPYKYNPITSNLDLVTQDLSQYITVGDNGIISIQFSSSPSEIPYLLTVDDTGHVVTTEVQPSTGSPIGLLMALTYP